MANENSPAEPSENHPQESVSPSDRAVNRIMEMGLMQMSSSSPFPPQLLDKITPEHLNRLIGVIEQHETNQHEQTKGNRGAAICIFFGLVATALALVLIFILTGQGTLLQEIVKGGVLFIAGLAGGWGIGRGKGA